MHRETTGMDIMLIEPQVRGAEPRPLLDSRAHEMEAKVSPDGRLLAYTVYDPSTSDEAHLHVCTFPELEQSVPVSTDWGWKPLWSPDGTELFFKNKDQKRLMVVDVVLDSELRVSEPRILLSGNFQNVPDSGANYDVSPDGERFLMVVEEELPETTPQIHIVLDWLSELERKMATDGR